METRRCNKCGVVKSISDFGTRSDVKGGLRAQCKSCIGAADRRSRHRLEVVDDLNLAKYGWVCSCGQGSDPVFATYAAAVGDWARHKSN